MAVGMHYFTARAPSVAIAIAALVMAACVSPRTYSQAAAERGDCPGDMRLQCSHRTAETELCTCVTPGEMERTVEELMRNPDPPLRQ